MNSKISKFAAAAVVLIAVALSIMLMNKSVTFASDYDVSQTIEAMKDVSVIHIYGRDWQDNKVEMWVKVSPDTGAMESCYLLEPAKNQVTVSTAEKTYFYDKNTNIVTVVDGPSISSIFRSGRFFEDIILLNKRLNGQINHFRVYDEKSDKQVILLFLTSTTIDLKTIIDPDSKLPISVNVIGGEQPTKQEILKDADEIYFSRSAPEGIFEFEIPADAKVVKQAVDDPYQLLPASIISYIVDFHSDIYESSAVRVNTNIFTIDGEFNVVRGGVLTLRNHEDHVLTGEVRVGNFSYSNIALFDENGKKLNTRIKRRNTTSSGKFSLYWILDEPIGVGQTKHLFYWMNKPEKLYKKASGLYNYRMNNYFGSEVVETFFLVLPEEVNLEYCSTNYTSKENIETFNIYAFKEHISGEEGHIVDVQLSKNE